MGECMDTFGGLVWSLALRACATRAEAEDATQEIFTSIWQSAARFDPAKGSEATFVAVIARRRLVDAVRKRARDRKVSEAAQLATADADTLRMGAESPWDDDAAAAREAMQELSEDQRRVLDLTVVRGHTHDETARITGLPLGTVKTHARRGLIKIRDILHDRTGHAMRGDHS